MNLQYRIEKAANNVSIIHLSGKIIHKDDIEQIDLEISNLIETKKLNIILSLTELDYMNSAGLSFVVSYFTKIRNAGGEMVLCDLSKKVNELIIITKLHTIFNIFDTLEEAIQSFNLIKNN